MCSNAKGSPSALTNIGGEASLRRYNQPQLLVVRLRVKDPTLNHALLGILPLITGGRDAREVRDSECEEDHVLSRWEEERPKPGAFIDLCPRITAYLGPGTQRET